MDDIARLLENYYDRLRERTRWKQIGNGIILTTPYLDRHNDFIQIYLFPIPKSEWLITDDGMTIAALGLDGFDSALPSLRQKIEEICNGFGVLLDGEAITISATERTFAEKLHSLLQVVIAVKNFAIGYI